MSASQKGRRRSHSREYQARPASAERGKPCREVKCDPSANPIKQVNAAANKRELDKLSYKTLRHYVSEYKIEAEERDKDGLVRAILKERRKIRRGNPPSPSAPEAKRVERKREEGKEQKKKSTNKTTARRKEEEEGEKEEEEEEEETSGIIASLPVSFLAKVLELLPVDAASLAADTQGGNFSRAYDVAQQHCRERGYCGMDAYQVVAAFTEDSDEKDKEPSICVEEAVYSLVPQIAQESVGFESIDSFVANPTKIAAADAGGVILKGDTIEVFIDLLSAQELRDIVERDFDNDAVFDDPDDVVEFAERTIEALEKHAKTPTGKEAKHASTYNRLAQLLALYIDAENAGSKYALNKGNSVRLIVSELGRARFLYRLYGAAQPKGAMVNNIDLRRLEAAVPLIARGGIDILATIIDKSERYQLPPLPMRGCADRDRLLDLAQQGAYWTDVRTGRLNPETYDYATAARFHWSNIYGGEQVSEYQWASVQQ